MKKRKLAVWILCGLLACGGAAGGAYALYSGTSDKKDNTFTIIAGKQGADGNAGDTVGEIIEEQWDESAVDKNGKKIVDNLTPRQIIAKDPRFKSKVGYDAWVVLKVEVPKEAMKVDGENGTYDVVNIMTKTSEDPSGYKNGCKEGWTELTLDEENNTGDRNKSIYYYGYDKKLLAGETTESSAFDAIQVQDITDLAKTTEYTVDVSALIIQAQGYDTLEDAWTAMQEEELTTVQTGDPL